MNKLSKRLLSIAQFVEKKDQIIDVGCDHGLLSIYLKENNICKKIIASDINQNALNNAIKNIKNKNLDIETYLSDGIKDIPLKGINTLIISGMGTSTILNILDDSNKLKKINKLIIQSNNNHNILRKELNDKNYYLQNEDVIFDKGKWYITMLFIKSENKNTKKEIEYGLLNNKEYNNYIKDQYYKIYKKIPLKSIKNKISSLKKYLSFKKELKKLK